MIQIKIENDILFAYFTEGVHLNITNVKKIVTDRLKKQNGKTYPIIIHINGLTLDSKEIRTFMATAGIEGVSHGAFVVKNVYERNLVIFFLSIDNPPIPTAIFSEEESAIKWIEDLRKN